MELNWSEHPLKVLGCAYEYSKTSLNDRVHKYEYMNAWGMVRTGSQKLLDPLPESSLAY